MVKVVTVQGYGCSRMDRDYVGKGSSYTYISLGATVVLWLVMIFLTFNLCPKSVNVVSPLLPADIGGVAREERGQESTTVLCIRYQTTHETTKTHSLAFLGSYWTHVGGTNYY